MTTRQLAVLNAMITFAAENIPGGLSGEEQEVAEIVGRWVLEEGRVSRLAPLEAIKTHVYRTINCSHYTDVNDAANAWTEQGWRVVAAIGSKGPGYAHQLILERPVGVSHPDD